MAHIHLEDGAFSPFWVLAWWAVTLIIIGIALFLIRSRRKPDNRRLTIAAFCVTAAFALSQIEIPIASGVHLSLTPLIAILTGPVVGLFVVFITNILDAAIGHGGWGMIGANTLVSFSEVLVAYAIWRGLRPFIGNILARAATATLCGLILGNFVMMGIVGLSGIQGAGLSMEQVITGLFLIASINVAVAVIEALLTGLVVLYIGKMRPDLLEGE
jgi:cobalt/nickel transport system permease protein